MSRAPTTSSSRTERQALDLAPEIRSEIASLALALGGDLADQMEIVREIFSERAAIREYLGGLARRVAEGRALSDTRELLGLPRM